MISRQGRMGHVELPQVLVELLPSLHLLRHARAVHLALQPLLRSQYEDISPSRLSQGALQLATQALQAALQAIFHEAQLPLQRPQAMLRLAPVLAAGARLVAFLPACRMLWQVPSKRPRRSPRPPWKQEVACTEAPLPRLERSP